MQLVIDATSSGAQATSWTHTTGATNSSLGVVWGYVENSVNPTGATWDGVAMTQVFNATADADSSFRFQVYTIANPPLGAKTVAITGGSANHQAFASMTVGGAPAASPIDPTMGKNSAIGGGDLTASFNNLSAGELLLVALARAYGSGSSSATGLTSINSGAGTAEIYNVGYITTPTTAANTASVTQTHTGALSGSNTLFIAAIQTVLAPSGGTLTLSFV